MRIISSILCMIFFITGCNQQSNMKQQQAQSAPKEAECLSYPTRYYGVEQTAKTLVEKINGIDEAVVLMIDDEMDVAVKVTNFDRFRLNPLRKEIYQKLTKAYPKKKIRASTDSKIYSEFEKISQSPWPSDKQKACKQQTKLKDIEKKMKG